MRKEKKVLLTGQLLPLRLLNTLLLLAAARAAVGM
jgi:hypothetical protein